MVLDLPGVRGFLPNTVVVVNWMWSVQSTRSTPHWRNSFREALAGGHVPQLDQHHHIRQVLKQGGSIWGGGEEGTQNERPKSP